MVEIKSIEVTDEEGQFGWGGSTLEGHTEAVEGTLNTLCERFEGYEADNIEHIWQISGRLAFYRGGPVFMSAISGIGIDIAPWDLKGNRIGVPIHQLLGGKSPIKPRVIRSRNSNATEDISWLDSPRLLESSIEHLKAVKALGMDAALDFHGRLHKPMVKQLAKAFEHISLSSWGSPFCLSTPRPLGCGALPGRYHWCVDVLRPDISHCGGISELRRIASMAETYDVAIAPHCPLGPIALAACLRVDRATPNFVIQDMNIGIHYSTDAGESDFASYVKNSKAFDVEDGVLDALNTPGLGIEVDEEAVRRVAQLLSPGNPRTSLDPMALLGVVKVRNIVLCWDCT
ncbi:enolase C-terminal domain-like protein [Penicillium canariense]|uniref:Enolase C-terminal domain-like protein n=1 Tax=Penicillium canariense TaxID=189055 RepID=A0A9W9HT31_9EURO|nr:enolase C-terminal domain-like protein [Penicillium canariense]KAJ5157268.1 enolase C-terminal domain-like protein [Penicillium canariense]